ncbi:DNA polymerase III subunit chi [Betaproteobacteria bacterium SCN2]|nr:DNA polymerase III subunit chi [Betaproteobacteria bacterium SCN2]
MTEVSFYSHATDKLGIARQLIAKAWAQKLNVLIYAPDETVAADIDRLLWTQPALSFIPHCRDSSPLAASTPVIIGMNADALPSADVLVNLGEEPPPVFSRFERLVEIVTEEESDVLKGRQRYRFYRDRGYELVNHDLRNRGQQ